MKCSSNSNPLSSLTMSGEFSIYHLHEHEELLDQCCELLNSEWKRSNTARLHSLERSSDKLPCSLLLIQEGKEIKVIGHSRLSKVVEDPHGCLVTSVIVTKELRGRGLGKYLMLKTEEYGRMLGYETIYLSTHDKQQFYEHLGYKYCNGISAICSAFGSNVKPIFNFKKKQHLPETSAPNCKSELLCNKEMPHPLVSCLLPPPPPPLPLVAKRSENKVNEWISGDKVWMSKCLL